MINRALPTWIKRVTRRSQSGQSIVVLAIGFVALLAFVGIVTDVSLMFVRYTTLTRAIDAASIAAAGQVRRQVPFQSEVDYNCPPTDTNGVAYTVDYPCDAAEGAAFARSYGNVGVAARQFIEFYGLDPQSVAIDTCYTVSTVDSDNNLVALNPDLQDTFDELCVGPDGRNSERKLIKVTAQIESPTVFMRLLGFQNFLLTASAISETAVLDVIVIMDVSESMLNQTTYDTWGAAGYNKVYIPPDIGWYNYNYANEYSTGVGFGKVRDNNFSDMTGYGDYTGTGNAWYRFRAAVAGKTVEQIGNYLNDQEFTDGTHANPFYVREYTNPNYPGAGLAPATECKVAYFPQSSLNVTVPQSVLDLYDELGVPWTVPVDSNGYHHWTGFVPNYDFFRCCNDPNANGTFEDLICQPFLQARDATEKFIQRIDFLRGDRLGFVTFDRQAFIMNVETETGSGVYSHMIDNETVATDTLKNYIGVRSEPAFYEPTTLSGNRTDPANWETAVPWVDKDYVDGIHTDEDWRHISKALIDGHDYEVADNCPFYDAALPWPYSPASAPTLDDVNKYGLPAVDYDPYRSPNLLLPDAFNGDPGGQRMFPRGPGWEGASSPGVNRSYDLWASCRGTNMGAALRAASNALLDPRTTRTNGSVWVMVLLSDGAAGASDPVFDSNNGTVTEPSDLAYPYDNLQRVKYGGLGLCPAGDSAAAPAELTAYESPIKFPFCGDEIPETRHFCFDPNRVLDIPDGSGGFERINTYVDLGYNCQDPNYYDVDDYARDWADWIGLADPPGAQGNTARNSSQLPTIFTIGFGLNFAGNTQSCKTANTDDGTIQNTDIGDCLGEELLRYIADVGDNFRVDTDYEQALMTNKSPVIGSMTDADFGSRGECEKDLDNPAGHTFNDLIHPLPAGQSCGNYYNAPDSEELNRVFDDIASRMFTRLSQ